MTLTLHNIKNLVIIKSNFVSFLKLSTFIYYLSCKDNSMGMLPWQRVSDSSVVRAVLFSESASQTAS